MEDVIEDHISTEALEKYSLDVLTRASASRPRLTNICCSATPAEHGYGSNPSPTELRPLHGRRTGPFEGYPVDDGQSDGPTLGQGTGWWQGVGEYFCRKKVPERILLPNVS